MDTSPYDPSCYYDVSWLVSGMIVREWASFCPCSPPSCVTTMPSSSNHIQQINEPDLAANPNYLHQYVVDVAPPVLSFDSLMPGVRQDDMLRFSGLSYALRSSQFWPSSNPHCDVPSLWLERPAKYDEQHHESILQWLSSPSCSISRLIVANACGEESIPFVYSILDALKRSLRPNSSIQHLGFYNCSLSESAHWEYLITMLTSSKCPIQTLLFAHLRSPGLNLSSNSFTKSALKSLQEALVESYSRQNRRSDQSSRHASGLSMLSVCGSDLYLRDKTVTSAMTKVMEAPHCCLEALDLTGRSADPDWLLALSRILQRSTCRITSLYLFHAPYVGSDHAPANESLIQALKINKHIRSFQFPWATEAYRQIAEFLLERNIRLQRSGLVKEDLVEPRCAKLFLCGHGRVGKTTLRTNLLKPTSLKHVGRRLAWSTPDVTRANDAGFEESLLELHKSGQVVFFKSAASSLMHKQAVILNPTWFYETLVGSFVAPMLRPIQESNGSNHLAQYGIWREDAIRLQILKHAQCERDDINQILHYLEKLEFFFVVKAGPPRELLFPTILPDEGSHGAPSWHPQDSLSQCFFGRRLECEDSEHSLLPWGVFTRLQVHLHAVYGRYTTQYRVGYGWISLTSKGVEAFIRLGGADSQWEDRHWIDIMARCTSGSMAHGDREVVAEAIISNAKNSGEHGDALLVQLSQEERRVYNIFSANMRLELGHHIRTVVAELEKTRKSIYAAVSEQLMRREGAVGGAPALPGCPYLTDGEGKWRKLREITKVKQARLQLMCESEEGCHRVEGQMGVGVTLESPEWLARVAPALIPGLKLVYGAAKIAASIFMPGVHPFLPDADGLLGALGLPQKISIQSHSEAFPLLLASYLEGLPQVPRNLAHLQANGLPREPLLREFYRFALEGRAPYEVPVMTRDFLLYHVYVPAKGATRWVCRDHIGDGELLPPTNPFEFLA
ncbi:hypothetical protein L7F22_068399 [Adiantum nelumboides]|nr:hypothetical protein [Adiantum nelumboides]